MTLPTSESSESAIPVRYADLARFDAPALAAARRARVLVVGAGGIGCELLKALVLHGFEQIETVDLDTIDLSNLNRQFLFRRAHIGRPKAEVAAAAVQRFNPRARVRGTLGNIVSDARFDVAFFARFAVVCNALDNLAARRHVNRLCLAAKVPLIESGTAGYLGQATVIRGGETECYECQPKPAPKTFAVCTINSTPSKPVHCVVWAKKLYGDLFGPRETALADAGGGDAADDAALQGDDEYAAGAAAQADEAIGRDVAALERERTEHGEWRYQFYKHFHHDIFSRVRVAELAGKTPWAGRSVPVPLSFESAATQADAAAADKPEEQRVPSVAQSAREFVDVCTALEQRGTRASFDKDDDLAMRFVCAASNLRSHIFSIALQSPFQVKSIAGNIVPAIATTNACIAGLIVLEAIKVVTGRTDQHRATFLLKQPSVSRKLLSTAPEKPNPACYVCQRASQTLTIDTTRTTLGALLKLLRSELSFVAPQVMRGDTYLYESGEGLDDDELAEYKANSDKTLAELGLKHNTIASIDDFSQKMEMQLIVAHRDHDDFDKDAADDNDVKYFRFDGKAPKAASDEQATADSGADDAADESSELTIVSAAESDAGAAAGKKRSRDEMSDAKSAAEDESGAKKRAVSDVATAKGTAESGGDGGNAAEAIEISE